MKEAEATVPHLFRCPISLEVFKDPVTLCTGQTYDRSSIEQWLASGNFTCPVTMQRLHDLSVVPNHTLRHLIDQWQQTGNHFLLDPDRFTSMDSLLALRSTLEASEASLDEKLQTVKRISISLEESPASLQQLGFLPLLLKLVFGKAEAKGVGISRCRYMEFVEQAASCVVGMLALGQVDSLSVIKEESMLPSFLSLLEHGSPTVKVNLCRLVEVASSSPQTKDLSATLGNDRQLLRSIIRLLEQESKVSDAGITAILSLCNLESTLENLVRQGAVHGLVTYILNADRQRRSSAHTAMAALRKILAVESGKEELVNHPSGVKALVKMVFRFPESEDSDSAVSSLLIVCNDSVQAREQAISSGVVTQLLLVLQSQCSGSTKTKAGMLLKLL